MPEPGQKYGDTIPHSPFHIDPFREVLDDDELAQREAENFVPLSGRALNLGYVTLRRTGIDSYRAALRAKLDEAESATLLPCTLCGGAGIVPGSGSTSAADPLPCSKCGGSGVVGFVSADYARNLSRQNADLREAIGAMADGHISVNRLPHGKWDWRINGQMWTGQAMPMREPKDSAADAALAGVAAMKGEKA